MGFFYRKSVNLGPFRVNLSGSGVDIRSAGADFGSARAPSARQTILTLESRLPFPSVPEPINVMPAWRWMFDASY
jgi:hypothetical protein